MSQFTPPPIQLLDYAALHEDHLIENPKTKLLSYGFVPEMHRQNVVFPSGEIYLRAGKHKGAHRGFGVNHIWAERGNELPRHGCKTIHDVPRYLADLITHNAPIVSEFYQTREGYRLTILRSAKGCVILAPWLNSEGENFYSIVTTYRHNRVNGTEIGRVQVKKAP